MVICLIYCILVPMIATVHCDNDEAMGDQGIASSSISTEPGVRVSSEDIRKATEKFESFAALAYKRTKDKSSETVIEKQYSGMMEVVADFVTMLTEDPNNAHKLLFETKSLDRIIGPHLKLKHTALRTSLLLLIKTLFKVNPVNTSTSLHINVLDRLLDIFEKDEDLGMKAHILDILYLWLPGNPRIQGRVMQIKGLEPFYNQMGKLDKSGILKSIKLFNTILIEHMTAKNDTSLYKKVGLIERISTPTICKGLLNVFESIWALTTDENNMIVPVFDLIKNVKPFCMKVFKRVPKASKLFNSLQRYVNDNTKQYLLEQKNVNVNEIQEAIEDYAAGLKNASLLIKQEL